MSTDHTQQARLSLDLLRTQVDAGFSHLKALCSENGRLNPALLDQQQQVSYELAFCVADLEACKAMLLYADKVNAETDLCHSVALAFCAETARGVWQRLLNHAQELGLPSEQLLTLMGSDPLADFLAQHGNSRGMADVGAALLDRGNVRLPTGLGEEKDLVRESFARFADDVVMPQAEHIHRFDTDIPDALITAAAQMGCFGTCIPEQFGGLMPDDKHDSLGMLVVTEELSRGSLGAAGSLITRPEIAARALLHGGTDEQKQHYLPRLAAGEMLAAISITEPDYGSDVASLSLKASKTEHGWALNGAKTWCTFAGKADVVVVIARTDPDRSKGHRGLSMFMVEKPRFAGHEFTHENPEGGRLVGRAIPTIGYRGMHSYDLSFEDFIVPDSALVGGDNGQGQGFYLTMAGLSGGRIQTAARASGVMQAALDKAVSYSNDRKVFGAPVGDYQLTQVKLGRMLAALTASRQFSYAVADLMDNGSGQMEASLVKLFSCRAAEWVTREALQIHGGMGYAEETDVSRYFVDARVLSIFEGAEETLALKVIARDLIAKAS
ncbi:MAG: acyl-CoA dehydrogenase family protein [Pseudomonadota bacterium]|nr:acyl-CoA dehydrogenase family protein [Pseudomonadota bacterium]